MGNSGFVPSCYTHSYKDAQGLSVGDMGLRPPLHGTKGPYGFTNGPETFELEEGCYDKNYRDANSTKPGDTGMPVCVRIPM